MRNTGQQRSRIEQVLLPDGLDPDPRFTLANERTFLSWIRTSLAFLAGGIALEGLAADFLPAPYRTVVAVLLTGIGAMISFGAAIRWIRVERRMRTQHALPIPFLVPALSATGGAAAVGLLWLLLEPL